MHTSQPYLWHLSRYCHVEVLGDEIKTRVPADVLVGLEANSVFSAWNSEKRTRHRPDTNCPYWVVRETKVSPPPTFEGISGGKWIHCFISHTDVREIAVTKASSSSSSGGHLSCHSSVYFTLKCPRDVFQQPVQSLQTLALSMIPTRFSVQEHQLYLLWITSVFHNDGKKTILFYSNDLWCFIRISIHKHKKRIF